MKNNESDLKLYQKRPKRFIRSELKDASQLMKAGHSMEAGLVIQADSPRDSMELTTTAYFHPKISAHLEIQSKANEENEAIHGQYDHYVQAERANVSSWYFLKSNVLQAIRNRLVKRIKELRKIISNTKNEDYGSTKSL